MSTDTLPTTMPMRLVAETVLANADRGCARDLGALRTAQRPASLLPENSFFTTDVLRLEAAKRTPMRLFAEAVALDQHLRGVLRDLDADIAGLDRARLQPEAIRAQQNRRAGAVADQHALDGRVRARHVEHRQCRSAPARRSRRPLARHDGEPARGDDRRQCRLERDLAAL